MTPQHALQLFARRVPQRCGPQAHGQSNFHTDGRQKAHHQQPASCSKSSDSDWGGDVGTVTTRAGTPNGQWGHGAGSGGIACSLPSSLGRWGPRLGGRTLPQSYRRRCAIQVDTLGIEPRASLMLSGCDTTTPRALCKDALCFSSKHIIMRADQTNETLHSNFPHN